MTESVDPGPGVLTRQPGPTPVSGLSGRLGVPPQWKLKSETLSGTAPKGRNLISI